MPVLQVVGADVERFAAAHADVARDVRAAPAADGPAVAALPGDVGNAGAEFVTAVENFERSLLSVATLLADRYDQTAGAARAVLSSVTAVDGSNADLFDGDGAATSAYTSPSSNPMP